MKQSTKVISIIVVLLAVMLGGAFMLGLFKKKPADMGELVGYRYHSSGDMLGSSYEMKIEKINENEALLSVESREWHGAEPEITEYRIDRKVLDEINEVFLNEGMAGWNNKKFSDIQVMDGASYGYSFSFPEDTVSFSSQIYPEPYSSKLEKIGEIIAKYLK